MSKDLRVVPLSTDGRPVIADVVIREECNERAKATLAGHSCP